MNDEARALTPLTAADYNAIEQAVMETARGRWFLREFASRNRQADTAVLLDAISRLERAVTGERAMQQVERIRFDLLEMAKSISRLKHELDAGNPDGEERNQFDAAASALDGIVKTTERATSNILEATESIQEVAWALREKESDGEACDRIDKLATDIYTACAFQDLTAQQTTKVVRTLRFLEGRINALVDAWSQSERGPAPLRAEVEPTTPHEPDLSQSDIDIVIVSDHMTDFDPVDPVAESHIPPNVAAAMRRTASDIDWEPGDAEPLIIDDSELIEVGFAEPAQPPADADHSDHGKAAPQPRATTSLAEIDAMSTTSKVLIFG
jgi:chemotaxis regulatin CheY-phosphate phosphatase CheZ